MTVYSVVRHYWEEDDLVGVWEEDDIVGIAANMARAKQLAEEDAACAGCIFSEDWHEYPDVDEASRDSSWGVYAILPWTVVE